MFECLWCVLVQVQCLAHRLEPALCPGWGRGGNEPLAGPQRSEGVPSTVALREPPGIGGLLEVRSFPGKPARWGTQGTGSRRTQQSEPAQGPWISPCVSPEPAVGCAAQSGQPVGQTTRASAVVLSRLGVGRAGAAGGGAGGLCQYLTLVLSSRRLYSIVPSLVPSKVVLASPLRRLLGLGKEAAPFLGYHLVL